MCTAMVSFSQTGYPVSHKTRNNSHRAGYSDLHLPVQCSCVLRWSHLVRPDIQFHLELGMTATQPDIRISIYLCNVHMYGAGLLVLGEEDVDGCLVERGEAELEPAGLTPIPWFRSRRCLFVYIYSLYAIFSNKKYVI